MEKTTKAPSTATPTIRRIGLRSGPATGHLGSQGAIVRCRSHVTSLADRYFHGRPPPGRGRAVRLRRLAHRAPARCPAVDPRPPDAAVAPGTLRRPDRGPAAGGPAHGAAA